MDALMMPQSPGLVALFSSGETSPGSQHIYDSVFSQLSEPVRMAILETPAGFQPNSALVAEKVAEFIRHHLQNYRPEVTVIPARRRGTGFSPEEPDVLAPMLKANVLYVGAGSPTYAVRQLHDSLAWQLLRARHQLGAAVILASAGVMAAGRLALPVYEIYKVGEDLHWARGLDLLGLYGLSLVLMSHWDNKEGGAELDTSHGFIGRERFEQMWSLLPPDMTIVGIDEHTALLIDLGERTCQVMGRGGVCLCHAKVRKTFASGGQFAIEELGPYREVQAGEGITEAVWQSAAEAHRESRQAADLAPPEEVLSLLDQRERAREVKDWARADALRDELASLGYRVEDTAEGPRLTSG